ncbi:hypothetical protein EVAR_96982_1 [Eumeta japonica]|uniref:Uncharacterized protein n=1 Tax=Eumeta variegata TaxID=151549 RepID=A0A4C1VCW6_EUMVA|nr:hypothetical protein EVAR_96982_1 [Eumeta japonica]
MHKIPVTYRQSDGRTGEHDETISVQLLHFGLEHFEHPKPVSLHETIDECLRFNSERGSVSARTPPRPDGAPSGVPQPNGAIDMIILADDSPRVFFTPRFQYRRVSRHFGFSFTVASEYGFLRRMGKMMDSVSMFRLVYYSTSFTSGGRSTPVTNALFFVVLPMRKEEKKEKNPLWAVRVPRHTGVSDSHGLKPPEQLITAMS